MIPQGENAFVLSNHQSWTDFYAIHTLAQRKGMLRRCRYFAKSSLRYIPFFGFLFFLMDFQLLTSKVGVGVRWDVDSRKELDEGSCEIGEDIC